MDADVKVIDVGYTVHVLEENITVHVLAGMGAAGADGSLASLNTLAAKAVIVGADIGLLEDSEDGNAPKKWSFTALITFFRNSLKIIKGQYDETVGYAPADGDTITLDYEAGNSQFIDASALGAGEAFTIATDNWPAADKTSSMIVPLKIGADPAVGITWPSGVVAPTLVINTTHWYVLSSLDGVNFRLAESKVAS